MRTAVILLVSVSVLACISLVVADESRGHGVYAFNEDLVAFANGKGGGKYGGGGGGYGGGYSSGKAGKSSGAGKRKGRSAKPPGGDEQKDGPQGRRRSPK